MTKTRFVLPEILLTFVTDDYLRGIGLVTSQWSLMESAIDQCIWQTAGTRNDYGRVISAQLMALSKLDTLAALLHQRKQILGEQVEAVSDYVKKHLVGRRNTVVHGHWNSEPDWENAFVVKFTARGRLTSVPSQWTADDLRAFALEIAEVAMWFMMLSTVLPKPRIRPGGLAHTIQAPHSLKDSQARKLRVLQPPTVSRKALEARKPQKKKK